MNYKIFIILIAFACLQHSTTTTNKDIDLDGKSFDDSQATDWTNSCTSAVRAAGCSQCECTAVVFDDDVTMTVTGDEENIDKLEDHIEDDGITILNEDYEWVEDDEDGTMTLIVTMSLFALMAFCIITFFACMPWPNSPEKIEQRRLAREQAEKEKEAEQKVTGTSSRGDYQGSRY